MKKWIKLIDFQNTWIRRGTFFRIPLAIGEYSWYPDDFTDFIVFDPNQNGVYGLMVASGNKAGLINVIFPSESSKIGLLGLKTEWLIENWNKWVYPDGNVNEVWLAEPISISSLDSP